MARRDPHPPSVFVGGVQVSAACLETLCEVGLPPTLVVGYDSSWREASGFVDFGPLANRHGLDLVRVADLNEGPVVERIASLEPAIVWVVGWSQLVRPPLLAVPRHGTVGIHPTRLPEGRGRAPIPWTILHGLDSTACTMFFLTEGVDDGPIVDQVEIEVDARETATTLYRKQLEAHCELLRRNAAVVLAGRARTREQDHSRATTWGRRRPEDGRIDWTRSSEEIDRLVRALTHPFPGAFFDLPEGRVIVWRAAPGPAVDADAGTVIRRTGEALVACGEGSLRLLDAEGLPG